jgi:hypothetical protein
MHRPSFIIIFLLSPSSSEVVREVIGKCIGEGKVSNVWGSEGRGVLKEASEVRECRTEWRSMGDAVYLAEDGESDMGRAISLVIILTKSPRLKRSRRL